MASGGRDRRDNEPRPAGADGDEPTAHDRPALDETLGFAPLDNSGPASDDSVLRRAVQPAVQTNPGRTAAAPVATGDEVTSFATSARADGVVTDDDEAFDEDTDQGAAFDEVLVQQGILSPGGSVPTGDTQTDHRRDLALERRIENLRLQAEVEGPTPLPRPKPLPVKEPRVKVPTDRQPRRPHVRAGLVRKAPTETPPETPTAHVKRRKRAASTPAPATPTGTERAHVRGRGLTPKVRRPTPAHGSEIPKPLTGRLARSSAERADAVPSDAGDGSRRSRAGARIAAPRVRIPTIQPVTSEPEAQRAHTEQIAQAPDTDVAQAAITGESPAPHGQPVDRAQRAITETAAPKLPETALVSEDVTAIARTPAEELAAATPSRRAAAPTAQPPERTTTVPGREISAALATGDVQARPTREVAPVAAAAPRRDPQVVATRDVAAAPLPDDTRAPQATLLPDAPLGSAARSPSPSPLAPRPVVDRTGTVPGLEVRGRRPSLGQGLLRGVSILTLILLFQSVALPNADGPPWELLQHPGGVTFVALAFAILVAVVAWMPAALRTRAILATVVAVAMLGFAFAVGGAASSRDVFDGQPGMQFLLAGPLEARLFLVLAAVAFPFALFWRGLRRRAVGPLVAYLVALAMAMVVYAVLHVMGAGTQPPLVALIDSGTDAPFLGDRITSLLALMPLMLIAASSLTLLPKTGRALSNALAVTTWAAIVLPLGAAALFVAKSDHWQQVLEPIKVASFLAAVLIYAAAAFAALVGGAGDAIRR